MSADAKMDCIYLFTIIGFVVWDIYNIPLNFKNIFADFRFETFQKSQKTFSLWSE